ncbi:HAD family hydrolase [Flavobacterium silvaticum]|uniref:HAD family phosphatase n=1 Tax=Flavobacterium silvaticum TaxID=1852020 RepID=A0A972FRI1_9FLAO|nr:HAD family phosphatase [Flavobacterium silvaticum]NMH28039.1 HAD family phosphatase [Flavobacterium silvaticum]
MINTIIFDFGDIFVNLNRKASEEAFRKLGLAGMTPELDQLNDLFEKGKVSEQEFLDGFSKEIPNATLDQIREAWNLIIGDFPLERLEFLQMLVGKYRMFLLTNTDQIHIAHFEDMVGPTFAGDFYRCFEKVFYSYEMGMRKPDIEVFNTIIRKYDLDPRKTLFIDDKTENTDAAKQVGIKVWNLQVGEEDVMDLFDKKFEAV